MKRSAICAPSQVASLSCSTWPSVSTPRVSPLAARSISRNSARKIGIWTRIGRQEANGLVPVSL